jgi:hypothetical protein
MPGGVRRFLLLAVAVVALGALLIAPAQGAPKYRTTVIVSLKVPAFHGSLASPSKACTVGRTVKVFRKRGGNTVMLKKATSNAKGKWSAPIGKNLTSGEFWSQATARGNCKAAKSKMLTID